MLANLENNSVFAMITHFSWPFQFHWQSQNTDSHSGRGANTTPERKVRRNKMRDEEVTAKRRDEHRKRPGQP